MGIPNRLTYLDRLVIALTIITLYALAGWLITRTPSPIQPDPADCERNCDAPQLIWERP